MWACINIGHRQQIEDEEERKKRKRTSDVHRERKKKKIDVGVRTREINRSGQGYKTVKGPFIAEIIFRLQCTY